MVAASPRGTYAEHSTMVHNNLWRLQAKVRCLTCKCARRAPTGCMSCGPKYVTFSSAPSGTSHAACITITGSSWLLLTWPAFSLPSASLPPPAGLCSCSDALPGTKRSGVAEEQTVKKAALGVQEWLKREKTGLQGARSAMQYKRPA